MKLKPFLITWLLTAVILFVINGIFHGVLAADFFDTRLAVLGDVAVKMKDFNPIPIVILELVIDFSILITITRMKNERVELKEATIIGGLFYLSTSASWNLANTATFITWPITVTVVDILWHFITGLLAGWIIYKVFNRQFATK